MNARTPSRPSASAADSAISCASSSSCSSSVRIGGAADQRARAHHRADRAGGDLVRERCRGVAQVVVLDEAGDQPEQVRVGGGERAVGEHQLQRARGAERPGQRPRRAAVGGEPDRAVGRAQLRAAGADDDVAGADQAESGPGHRAVDAGHHGDGGVEQQPDDLVPVVRELADEGAGVRRRRLKDCTSPPTQKRGPLPSSSTARVSSGRFGERGGELRRPAPG